VDLICLFTSGIYKSLTTNPMTEFTHLAIIVQNEIANGDYTHQKYLQFREWYFQNYDGSKRNAVRDFKMFDLMYGLDVPIKNDSNEDV
jgi:hypothetical protein